MKKVIVFLMSILLLCAFVIPALAAPPEPVIIRQPQNPVYPEYSVAEYSVTVYGTNLRCTWYLQYDGKTYNISDTEGSAKPWNGTQVKPTAPTSPSTVILQPLHTSSAASKHRWTEPFCTLSLRMDIMRSPVILLYFG